MLKIEELTSFCQQLVDAVSRLLGGRTINIMDLDGIIIASTDKERIGTLHTGARHVVTSGHDLAITEKLLPNYPGAKVGYNMPLTFHGRVFGVIGMYGIPEQVRDMSQLLKIYADKYFEIEGTMEARLLDLSLRSKLFGLLAAGNGDNEGIGRVMEMLDISFSFPVSVIRIAGDNGISDSFPDRYEKIVDKLSKDGFINARRDFWSIEADSLMIIRSFRENGNGAGELPDLPDFQVIAPLPAADFREISQRCNDARWFYGSIPLPVVDLSDPQTRLICMMHRTAEENADFIDSFIARIRRSMPEQEMLKCMEAVILYYDENRSVTRAADKLGIHKNTLQARVRRVLEAAGIEDYPPAERAYVMRLISIRLTVIKKTSSSLNKLG